jgi:hypothetical protein
MLSTGNVITFHTKTSDEYIPRSMKILVIKSFVRASADRGLRRWISGSAVSVRGQPQHGGSPHVFLQLWQSQTVNMWNTRPALTMG